MKTEMRNLTKQTSAMLPKTGISGYTGVTSVNDDASNIGFILVNERTSEAHYYSIAGADESSAMAAAEGEVQEKGYRASFRL